MIARKGNFRVGIFMALLCAATAVGQTITGQLSGVVTDPMGAVIVNATVSLRHLTTNATRATTTDAAGRYLFTNLEPGLYQMTVSAAGFKTAMFDSISIQVATHRALDVALEVGSLTEVFPLDALAPLLEYTTSDVGAIMTGQWTRNLPLNGRDFAQLTRLTAGATTDAEGGAAAFVVNGQRASANNFLVDGIEANDPLLQINAAGSSGTSAAYASVDTILEFKVQTSNFSAEFGRYAGAVVNVITRAGTNDFHGSLFEFLRNDALDANNYFNNAAGLPRPPLRSHQFGGVIGGPIKKDALFFFASYEGIRQSFGAISNGTVASLLARQRADARIRPVINQIVLPTGPPLPENPLLATFTGITPSRLREDNVSLRLDANIDTSDRFFIRYAGSDGRRRFGGSSAAAAPNVVDDGVSRLQHLTFSHTHIFSSTLINEFRLGLGRIKRHEQSIPLPLAGAQPALDQHGHPTLPLVIVSDQTLNNNIVGGVVGPQGDAFNTFQYMNHLSYLHGRHNIKLGADVRRVQLNRFNEGANGGQSGVIVFATTDDLIANVPQAFINQVGIRRRGFRFTNLGVYAQEDFHAAQGLSWNIGLRYELNTVLKEVNRLQSNIVFGPDGQLQLTPLGAPLYRGDYNNLAPRVGFAFAPPKQLRWVLRGGFGVYFDQLTQIATNLMSNPPVTLTNTAFLPGPYPDFLPFLPTTPPSEPPFGGGTMIPLNARTPYSYQYNLNLQLQLSATMRAQIAYVGSRGIKLLRERIINFLFPFGTVPGPITGFQDTNFGLIQVNEPSAQSVYSSMQLTFERRLRQGFSVLANYTWSHSIDDASTLGLFGTQILGARSASPFPSNPNNAKADRGNSNFDVRHIFNLSYSWELPLKRILKSPDRLIDGWAFHGIISSRTGQPFTVAVGSDAAGIGDATPFFSQRPNLVPGVPLTLGRRRGPRLPLNPAAFSVPTFGTFGNLGRNTFRGPSFSQYDIALSKTIALGEQWRLQLRVEAFNLFNRANFSLPTETANLNVAQKSPEAFGTSTSTVNSQNLNVGPIFGPGGPRSFQIGIKILRGGN
ncbi:MAG: carboxypeptidase regulatory-like domain-containing protein [Acidobacteriota bacterium]|nr:carboxypeptidase regulatory-like domain-containing protein [Blastocatellia bacterium]MDW8240377.1 carboxypeptidase regulatory-like domain-containing protein [Acidobacteriota bacterium]